MVQSGKSELMYTLTSENKIYVMKTVKYIQSKIAFPLALVLLTLVGCERDLSDEVLYRPKKEAIIAWTAYKYIQE